MSCTSACGQQHLSTRHKLMKLMGFFALSLCQLWSASLRPCPLTDASLAGAAARKCVPCTQQYLTSKLRHECLIDNPICYCISAWGCCTAWAQLLLLLLQEAEHAAAIAGVELLTAEKVLRPDAPAGSHSRGTATASPSVSSATSGVSLPGVGSKRSKSNADPLDEDSAGEQQLIPPYHL